MRATALDRYRFTHDEADLPLALADLHRGLAPGTQIRLELRSPTRHAPPALSRAQLIEGAGFIPSTTRSVFTRAETLPDYVGPTLRLLCVGLNPSLYAARAGIGFARPGNRFWPAMLRAGLVQRDRDPRDALLSHGVGMTDLVKRATAQAAELSGAEYRAGFARITALARWLAPPVVCFVGLSGYRAAVDRRADTGIQSPPEGWPPAVAIYVMPNPSGLNAHATVASLADHFRAASALAARSAGS